LVKAANPALRSVLIEAGHRLAQHDPRRTRSPVAGVAVPVRVQFSRVLTKAATPILSCDMALVCLYALQDLHSLRHTPIGLPGGEGVCKQTNGRSRCFASQAGPHSDECGYPKTKS
jgi:hypothetical protein